MENVECWVCHLHKLLPPRVSLPAQPAAHVSMLPFRNPFYKIAGCICHAPTPIQPPLSPHTHTPTTRAIMNASRNGGHLLIFTGTPSPSACVSVCALLSLSFGRFLPFFYFILFLYAQRRIYVNCWHVEYFLRTCTQLHQLQVENYTRCLLKIMDVGPVGCGCGCG